MLSLTKCLESFHAEDHTRRKNKSMCGYTHLRAKIQRNTLKRQTQILLGHLSMWISHQGRSKYIIQCYRFLKLTRRDEGKKKKSGANGYFLSINVSEQTTAIQICWMFSWILQNEETVKIMRPINSYPRNIFQLQVVSDPFWPHSHCKNLFNYLPLLQ